MITLQCPLCKTELRSEQRRFVCENGHSFDQAKEGYVNLLLVQNKNSKQPGDNKAMLQSRRRFLEAGYYAKLAEFLSDFYLNKNFGTALDIGAGEGYYSAHIAERLSGMRWSALDIAKPGMQMLAKRRYTDFSAVASAYDLPFASAQFDTALSIFSPLSESETSRVLKPNGNLVFVGPAPNHLAGLAEKVYDTVQPHKGNDFLSENSHFELLEQHYVNDEIVVEGQHILDLLSMTPYYWSASKEKQEALMALDTLSTALAFDIKIYKKIE